MAFDWKEYLNLAYFLEGLSETNFSQEAAFRCATSRAYYAAFCHARNYARDHENFSPTGTVAEHGLVRKHFREKGQIDIASKLEDLRQWRNPCDYDDVVGDLSQKLKSALQNAQEIIGKLT